MLTPTGVTGEGDGEHAKSAAADATASPDASDDHVPLPRPRIREQTTQDALLVLRKADSRGGGLADRSATKVAAQSEPHDEARALGAHLEVSLLTEHRREKDLIDAATNASQRYRRERRDLDLLDFLFDVVR